MPSVRTEYLFLHTHQCICSASDILLHHRELLLYRFRPSFSGSPGGRPAPTFCNLSHIELDQEAESEGDYGERDADTGARMHLYLRHFELLCYRHHKLSRDVCDKRKIVLNNMQVLRGK